ncbi:hypothetical protein N0V90_006636 [Kalmusia sp. IMI 367209]|nr:hypothetical protein N0V90_006636 [Kalmusia sp. IMI 367209]
MASANYNPYNYSYQHTSAQQYSAFQTAPASNSISQSSRQYQSAPATSQATNYMSYQAQSYHGQENAYGGTHDNALGGNNYGGNRESTSRAAEVLQNMSNTAYTSTEATVVGQSGFTATNAAIISRFSSNTSRGDAHQPSQTQAPSSAYGQPQRRPQSVNVNRGHAPASRGLPSPATAAGYSSQRASTTLNQQPRRSTSPSQYSNGTHTLATSTMSAAMTAATQYNDYSNRQLPNLNATRSTGSVFPSSYSYGDTHASTSVSQAPTSNAVGTYSHPTVTVDPMAIYDPWPEYERKQVTLRAQKAVEDAAREEEARKEEERKREEEKRKQEEGENRVRQGGMSKSQQKSRKSQQSAAADADSAPLADGTEEASPGDDMESEIRALMAKMREFNSKDPALLARVWEEERRAKAPKAITVSANAAPQAATAANSRKKVSAKETPTSDATKSGALIATQHASRPAVPATTVPTRTSGKTIWPPEKKAILATAAAAYLNGKNPQMLLQAEQILGMLDGNPSYIELCEQLESMDVKLDRAAFAKNLLTVVPDVNSSRRSPQGTSNGAMAPNAPVAPPAIMKRDIGTSATPARDYTSAAPSSVSGGPDSMTPTTHTPAPVAEMVPIKPELKRPANKEEAARKRDFNDIIDLTQADEDDFEPPPKKTNIGSMYSYSSPGYNPHDYKDIDKRPSTNFPVPARVTPQPVMQRFALPANNELRNHTIVKPLDRKKALRRNNYNVKTIARDVLLACGRHPETRQLNQHLEILRTTILQVQQDSDLSTLRWDLIDPGKPPQGYFKASVRDLTEDSDKNSDDDEESGRPRMSSMHSGEGTDQQKTQAPLPEAINPFKQMRRRGRPPRHSFPNNPTTPSTPARPAPKTMSTSAPRAASAGVGYSAFRSATQYDANGNPLPKKRGRPVGWRKHIHGSAQAQTQANPNQFAGPLQSQPSQPSTLRNVNSGDNEPIRIDSRSPSALNQVRRYQSFKCKWQDCKADLHNLDTLKKHVVKVHQNSSSHGFIECHWADCGTEVTNQDALTDMRIARHDLKSFTTEAKWKQHLEQSHFGPLSWKLGDGPASGVSDATDSEAYLSDAQGRRVTPKVTARPEYLKSGGVYIAEQTSTLNSSAPRRRGRPPKDPREQEARDVQTRLIAQKKRLGGPGMDRGGATLVNEKRRRGFIDNDLNEEELVEADN